MVYSIISRLLVTMEIKTNQLSLPWICISAWIIKISRSKTTLSAGKGVDFVVQASLAGNLVMRQAQGDNLVPTAQGKPHSYQGV